MIRRIRGKNQCFAQGLLPLPALLLFGLFLAPAFAQTSTLVRGTIIDAQTRLPIPIVNVVVTNTPHGAATDSTGYFEIRNLPPDLYVLEFRHVAYRKRIHILQLKPSEQVTFTVELFEEPVKLSEVEVIANPERAERQQRTYASTVVTAAQIEKSGAKRLSEVLQAIEPGAALSPLARRRGISPRSWVPYLIYLDGAYVQYIAGTLDNIVDVRQIEKIEISRWVGVAPNIGPGTSDRVIQIFTKKQMR